MKYLIIDMDKLASIDGYESLSLKNHIGEEMILTKAETLAKFKEVFDAGYYCCAGDPYQEDWDEFKKEL